MFVSTLPSRSEPICSSVVISFTQQIVEQGKVINVLVQIDDLCLLADDKNGSQKSSVNWWLSPDAV